MEETRERAVTGSAAAEESKGMKVLVAVDEGEGSLYALNWALDHLFDVVEAAVTGGEVTEFAEHRRGRLTLVHVQQPFQHFLFPGPAAMPSAATVYASSSVVDSARKAQEQNTNKLLGRALQVCKERKVKAETLIIDGDPKEMICQAVEQIHPDLVVVGSRGLSKFQRAFLGSVSDYVAHHARCPVLIARPRK